MSSEPIDLRGKTTRTVHRDDAVVISGAEYLRLSHIKHTAGAVVDFHRAGADLSMVMGWLGDLVEGRPPSRPSSSESNGAGPNRKAPGEAE